MSDDDKWVVATIDSGPGEVTLGLYQRHDIGEPGLVVKIELSLHEIERLNMVTGQALWHRIKSLA